MFMWQLRFSPVYGYKFDFSSLLGSVERNSSGHVVSARSVMTVFLVEIDPSQGLSEEGGVGIELDLADKGTLAWEKEFVAQGLDYDKEEGGAMTVYINAARRWASYV